MKKTFTRFIAFLLVFGFTIQLPFQTVAISGADFSTNILAARLQKIFEGHVGMYADNACTKEVVLPLGSRYDKDTKYWIQNPYTGRTLYGWQCYIYGNAAYNALFHEWVGHANSLHHSERVKIAAGIDRLSYLQFKLAGVRCGAYIRTTPNPDGSFNADNGHSIIVLSYNPSKITVLEGNADRNGLVRVISREWNDFSNAIFTSRGRVLCHIIQPTKDYYDQLTMSRCRYCGEIHTGFFGQLIQAFHNFFLFF